MPTAQKRTLTLGRLAKTCGLARASLLHYETLGLLTPLARTAAGYRVYGEAEVGRLQSIRRFRDAGLSLQAIGELLKPNTSKTNTSAAAQLLERRLLELCKDMERLRMQQKQLARLLASPEFRIGRFAANKESWVALLRRAGLSESEMHEWHANFETDSPREHAAFLRSLGLEAAEVARIRRWSKENVAQPGK
jgi:MerR family transcriptional regulator, thiopeptide resistance regulator